MFAASVMLAVFFIYPDIRFYFFVLCIIAVILGAGCAWYLHRLRSLNESRTCYFRFYLWIILGLIIGYTRGLWYLGHILHAPSGRVQASGYIFSIPQRHYGVTVFDFAVTSVNQQPTDFKLRVKWRGLHPDLQIQDRWDLPLRIQAPKKMHYPLVEGEIDYARVLEIAGLQGEARIISDRNDHSASQRIQRKKPYQSIDVVRQKISEKIAQSVDDRGLAATLIALTTGSRHMLEKMDWQVFQNTGTSHLIAISGLHVSLVAGIFYFIASWLWRRSVRLLLWFPAQKIAAIAALVSAVLYSLLAGLSLPTQRSLVMLGVVLGSELLNRHIFLWYRWLLAFIVVLMIWPLAVLSVSFWLSYSAVFLIGWCTSARLGRPRGWWGWTYLQAAMSIGLLPMTLLFFGRISVVAIAANYIAIPFMSFIVVPCCVFSTVVFFVAPQWDGYLWWCSAKILSPLWWYLEHLAAWPHAVWEHALDNHAHDSHGAVFVSVTIGTCLLLLPRKTPAKMVAFIFFLPLFLR